MRNEKKRCWYCGKMYEPDARTARIQKSCGRNPCQKKRKKQSQKEWTKANPDYFRGRYAQLKKWRRKNRDYQREYVKKHPEFRLKKRLAERRRRRKIKRERVEIQDGLARRKIEQLRGLRGVDIQDTIKRQIEGVLNYLVDCPRGDTRFDGRV